MQLKIKGGSAMSKENTPTLKRRNIILVILLSIITLGVYVGYWFISSRKNLHHIDKKNHIPFKWWNVATVYLIFSLIFSILGEFFLSIVGLFMFTSVDLIFTYFFLGLLYYSVFRMKESLEEVYDEVEMNRFLLFIFHIWYIQYKINKTVKSVRGAT